MYMKEKKLCYLYGAKHTHTVTHTYTHTHTHHKNIHTFNILALFYIHIFYNVSGINISLPVIKVGFSWPKYKSLHL